MKPSLISRIFHNLQGGNFGSIRRSIRKTQQAYLDANKKNKMRCEYMETLELDDLLNIQSKHSEGTPIYLRVQFELQRRFNQDQIRAVYGSTWLIITATIFGAIIGASFSAFAANYLTKIN